MSTTCISRKESANQSSTDNTMFNRKRTSNDLENIRQKTKDGAAQTPQNIGGVPMCIGRVNMSCSNGRIRRVTVTGQEHHNSVTSDIVVIAIH